MNKKLLFFILSFVVISFITSFAQTLNEGFENPTFPPAGWHTKNILGGVAWMKASTIAHTGTGSAIIAWETLGGEDWLVTPQLNISIGDSLKFWVRKFWAAIYEPDTLQIRISTTDTTVASFTAVLATYNVNTFPNPGFGEYKINLSTFSGQNVYIAFRHYDVNGNGMYLDDVAVVGSVPVELASFAASVSGNDVTLSWVTATELNNSGFHVERSTGEDSWNNIGFVEGHGTTTETQSYTFLDKGLASGIYNYRIKQVDFGGSFKYYDLSQEIEIVLPNTYSLSQNYPNPFNPTTSIKYSVLVDGLVNITIFNMLGEKVANLVNGIHKTGNYEVTFDAANLVSGMYIYRMESGSYVSVKKMMILK
ncbi:MAG: choice-of-anchor J domain-containing protein [Ignavibacteriaceae bacterium]|nr:choice-of-anchor J domain-containing protein [Ignavibacteriaceae bacterium]